METRKPLSDTESFQAQDDECHGDDASSDVSEEGTESGELRGCDFSLRGDLSEVGLSAAKA